MSFRLDWIELVCPHCKGELDPRPAAAEEVDEQLWCHACQQGFPVVQGIPDLRVFPDPYISREGDHIKGLMLASRFHRLDLEGMIRTYYHITPETPPDDVELNVVRLLGAGHRAEAMVRAWDDAFGRVGGEAMLDVGCGTAPLLLATKDRFRAQVGVDVSFRWLVVAKRRLADAGVSIPLVAACGEALPFRAGAFDTVTMDSYLETTRNQDVAVTEAARVLGARGRLLVSTPNRFSVGPDPHIGIPGGGFLPAWLVNAIARQRMARPPLRRLLTARGLRSRLARGGLPSVRVEIPPLSDAQLGTVGRPGRVAGEWYNRLRRVPGPRQVLFGFGPMLHADARRA